MKTPLLLALLASLAAPLATGCVAETATDDDATPSSEDELQARADAHWFYNGALPVLEQPKITVSLKGNTAHLTGLLPLGSSIPSLPHVKVKTEGTRTRIDAVYPIATARPGKT